METFLLLIIIVILLGGGGLVLALAFGAVWLVWKALIGLFLLAVLYLVWSFAGWLGVVGLIVVGALLDAEEKGISLYAIECRVRRLFSPPQR
jgi:hypothetical protein